MAGDGREYGLYDRAIRALSGARDWWSAQTDPNKPRQIPRADINLPVTPPTPKPWYENIPAPLEIAEQIGRQTVAPATAYAKSTGGKIAGALGATSESSGRAFGAALDVFDPRNTGSEKKPASDILWEGLKGVRSGYEAGLGATSASQEFTKRAPESTLQGANPVQRGMLGLGLDVATDPTNLIPEKYLGAGLGAIVGAGPEAAQTAWLPPNLWKRSRNVKGFTTQLNDAAHADKILQEGFGASSGEDVLYRMSLHGSTYTPAQESLDLGVGIAPYGRSNQDYTGAPKKHMPFTFTPETKMLDINAPVPREDIDVILGTLHPEKDKAAIDKIEAAWQDQAQYAEGPGAVTHAQVRSGQKTPEQLRSYYEQLGQNPVAEDAIDRLSRLLANPYSAGEHGTIHGARYGEHGSTKTGTAPLNQPSMTTEFGGIYYPDYNASNNDPSIAADPRQVLFGPLGSQKNLATVPWTQGKLSTGEKPGFTGSSYKGVIPSDAPGGISSPLPGQAAPPPVTPQIPPPGPSAQQQAEEWAAQNIPEPTPAPKVYPPGGPQYKGQPISTYEQGTLKELKAAGRELTPTQTKKLAAIEQYEAGQAPMPVEAPTPDPELPPTVADSVEGTSPTKVSLLEPQNQEKMIEHLKDIQSIFEEHNVKPPAGLQSLDDFFDPQHLDSDSTPADLHENMIMFLGNTGHDKAAADLQELWDLKLKGDTVDSPELPSALPEGFEGFPDVPAPAKKTLTLKKSGAVDEFVKAVQESTDDYEIDEAWKKLSSTDQILVKNAHPEEYQKALTSKKLVEDDQAWLAGEQGDFEPWDEETIGKLPPVDAPLEPFGKDAIKTLDAEGSLDYLKNTYANVAENFAKHSGTEMGSIESHTKDVLKQWKTQLTPQDYADISQRYDTDVEALMNVALPLHDIGKPGALAAGDKTLQHSHTIPIMTEVLKKEGFDQKDIDLATELFNHDMIGSLLQGSSKMTPQQVADELVKKANKIGMEPSDFAKLQLAFFQADASSYPFVTQYMKQLPSGQWISGSPKVKPIEDLIAGPGAVKAVPAPTGEYQLKVADAEEILGGTKTKKIYTKDGQDYLFKEASPDYFADQEVAANKIANLSGLHPIKIEKTTMGGKVGTMQAAVGNNMNWPTLHQVDPKTLTVEELRDVIRNHPVDWLSGNMDAHGAQFLRTPNGIVEIDRGRVFKSYQGNKLHEDFNPTGGFGYEDQFYNNIVKAYKKGDLPQLSEGDIRSALDQTIFKMKQNENLIMKEIYDGLDRSNQGQHKGLANTRMKNLEKDLVKFWTGK